MYKNSKVLAVAIICLGMLLGYAATSGILNPRQRTEANPPATDKLARSQEPFRQPESSLPATGKAVALLKPLDTAAATMTVRHGIPGAALAIAKDGKLVFARGYGWANLSTGDQVQPDTLFGVASLSKTITAVAVLKLVEQGKLKLDDRPFEILNHIRPYSGAKVDRRLVQITVRQLLNHSGGWDHQASGDPVNWTTQMHLKRGDRTPVTAEQLIAFTMGVPLDFDPGTDSKYSNFGYIVLGEVIAKVTGQAYERFVQDSVFAPAGVRRAALHPLDGKYLPNEARRYLVGTDNELPPWQQKYSDAAGGWTVSAVDMVRLLTALDGSRGKPLLNEKTLKQMIELPPAPLRARDNGTHVGLGWDSVILTDKGYGYFKDGSWAGMRAFMKRMPTGVNAVLLFNASMNPDTVDTRIAGDAVKAVREALERLEKFPDIDLFSEFR
jgi:N-acyl-D-amino-acid deacylase